MNSENSVRNETGAKGTARMPVIFIGHGSPGNAFEKNDYSLNWQKLANVIPRPKVIICISAHWTTSSHWVTSGIAVTAMEKPRTIHDFYGFPTEYYQLKYGAPGSPVYARRIKELVKCMPVELDYEWGLDHGTWSVLVNMYPEADIPVLQLSIDEDLPLSKHLAIGQDLRELRQEGVLIMGSGDVVHNLALLRWGAKPYPWATEFDLMIRAELEKNNFDALVNYMSHPLASLALPTNEHYLPLLYTVGASDGEKPQFFNESIFAGSVSMRCVVYWDNKIIF